MTYLYLAQDITIEDLMDRRYGTSEAGTIDCDSLEDLKTHLINCANQSDDAYDAEYVKTYKVYEIGDNYRLATVSATVIADCEIL